MADAVMECPLAPRPHARLLLKRFTCVVLPLTFAAAACGSDHPNPTAPGTASASAPAVFQAGRYEMLISGGAIAGSCTGTPTGTAHVGTVNLRAENGDWIATSAGPGDTLRVRFSFEDFPVSRAFTGSVQGRAAGPIMAAATLPAVQIEAARLAGSALDREQGLGAIEAFGTIAGQLVFTSPLGTVTCSGGNLILQRANGL
jgi:hypothetical protein